MKNENQHVNPLSRGTMGRPQFSQPVNSISGVLYWGSTQNSVFLIVSKLSLFDCLSFEEKIWFSGISETSFWPFG